MLNKKSSNKNNVNNNNNNSNNKNNNNLKTIGCDLIVISLVFLLFSYFEAEISNFFNIW